MTVAAQPVRSAFLAAYRAALRCVDPYLLTHNYLSETTDPLGVGRRGLDTGGGVRVLAVGKAAHGMAAAAAACMGARLVTGLIIADHQQPSPHPLIRVMVGDHPYPGRASLAAGRAAMRLASEGHPDELLLVLVSGGGSSLMEVPAPGITFEDLKEVSRALVTGGVPIGEMNVVRRHLSAVKNGGIAERAGGRNVTSLLISDVVDGPASAIASGPTLADGTTTADALAVVADYRLERRLPPSAMEFLTGCRSSSPGPGRYPFQVLADGLGAAGAAHRELESQGFNTRIVATPLVGDAEQTARTVAATSVEDLVDVYWGETTVRIDIASPGRGGRNQHAAVAAAGCLEGRGRGVFGGFATDGIDGASEAAGGLVDAGTVARGRAAGLDRLQCLRGFDSSTYLEVCGDLVTTGPTGVNVGDLWLVTG